MNKISILMLIIILQWLSSCSTSRTWVVKRWQNGGIVGYQGDTHDMYSDVKEKVHCPYFKIIGHTYKSQQSKIDDYYEYHYPNTTFNTYDYYKKESKNEVSNVPTTSEPHWREVVYSCIYHPYYDYHRTINARQSRYSYYDPPIADSELPNCHGYYDYGCKLEE